MKSGEHQIYISKVTAKVLETWAIDSLDDIFTGRLRKFQPPQYSNDLRTKLLRIASMGVSLADARKELAAEARSRIKPGIIHDYLLARDVQGCIARHAEEKWASDDNDDDYDDDDEEDERSDYGKEKAEQQQQRGGPGPHRQTHHDSQDSSSRTSSQPLAMQHQPSLHPLARTIMLPSLSGSGIEKSQDEHPTIHCQLQQLTPSVTNESSPSNVTSSTATYVSSASAAHGSKRQHATPQSDKENLIKELEFDLDAAKAYLGKAQYKEERAKAELDAEDEDIRVLTELARGERVIGRDKAQYRALMSYVQDGLDVLDRPAHARDDIERNLAGYSDDASQSRDALRQGLEACASVLQDSMERLGRAGVYSETKANQISGHSVGALLTWNRCENEVELMTKRKTEIEDELERLKKEMTTLEDLIVKKQRVV